MLEEKQKELPAIEKKCKEVDIYFHEYKTKKADELDMVTKEMNPLLAKRETVKSQIDMVIFQRYEKVAKSRGGKAVVSLQENICQGCFQQILPQMVINVKVGESIHQCSSCLCFLYWEEVSETVMPK